MSIEVTMTFLCWQGDKNVVHTFNAKSDWDNGDTPLAYNNSCRKNLN